MDTKKRRGKWICRGLRSEFTDNYGVTYYVMDECNFHNDYDVTMNKLNLLNQRIRFKPTLGSPRSKTQRRYQQEYISPIYRRPSPSKLLEQKIKLKNVTIKSRPKYDIIITPKDKDPKWLYANYTGFIKDYDGNDVYVTMYSEKRD
jgi:hypothetical protein